MALIKYTVRALQCDEPACEKEIDFGVGMTAAELRNAALKEGWGFAKGDHCPDHR